MKTFVPTVVGVGLIVFVISAKDAIGQSEPLLPLFDGPVFQADAPDEFHPWAIHDRNRPLPPRVEPGTFSTQEAPGRPPSDAIVLFDGTAESLANWQSVRKGGSEPMKWQVTDGVLAVAPRTGNIRTKEEFGNVQLHMEWRIPAGAKGTHQRRGNTGVFFPGETEIQILGNHNNPTYADGYAGSIYAVSPPMAEPSRPDGEWQTYDIVFRRPIFKDGVEIDPGRFTVFFNGVLVQDATPLEGGGVWMKRTKPREFPETGPIMLQDHGDVVHFRNIWVRRLPPRPVDGGTDGKLTPEAATAKRAEIAAGIRAHAATLQGREQMMRQLESLIYERNEEAFRIATTMADAEVAAIQSLDATALNANKEQLFEFNRALNYIVRFQVVPEDYPARVALNALFEAQGWERQ